MLRLALLAALAAAAAAAAPVREALVQLAAEGPYGDPAADAAREALADTTRAWSANREWSDGTPPLIQGRDAVQHATVELAGAEAPTVPALGTGPESVLPPAESVADNEGVEGLSESDTGAPDGASEQRARARMPRWWRREERRAPPRQAPPHARLVAVAFA
jgi:hypothetical protein